MADLLEVCRRLDLPDHEIGLLDGTLQCSCWALSESDSQRDISFPDERGISGRLLYDAGVIDCHVRLSCWMYTLIHVAGPTPQPRQTAPV